MKSVLKYLSVAAVTATFTITGHSLDKIANTSGTWPGIDWLSGTDGSTTVAPTTADNVVIAGDRSVNFDFGAGSQSVVLVDIGYTGASGAYLPYLGSSSTNGTLTVSSGTLTATTTGSVGIRVGRDTGSNSALNIAGGLMQVTGSSARIDVAAGANSQGAVNITGGKLSIAGGGSVLGFGVGSTGALTISAGELESAGILYVGRRATGTTTGMFEQTGGTTTITGSYLAVGYGSASTQTLNATAKITGGQFSGNVRVGRQAAGGALGSGTLTIGHAADVSGRTGTWEISGNGEIIFELGTNDSFNAVDLTLSAVSNALVFSEAGAKITVDGTNLAFSEGLSPITFFTFADGKGPDATSLSNVSYNFSGFADGFDPTLTWSNTGLTLNLYAAIPEPSTYAAIFSLMALAFAVVRRRRTATSA